MPFAGQNAERSQSVGAPLVGALRRAKRREKPIGRGTPCGCPSQAQTPRTVQIIMRYRKFSTSLATGGRFLVRKRLTIGRGAPCGRPSWAIVTSEFRCDCPVPRAPPWIKGVKGVLRAPSRPFVDQKVLKVFSAPLRGPPWIKGFQDVLHAPPWIKGVKGVLRAPSRPFVDQKVLKVFSVPLPGPPWIKRC